MMKSASILIALLTLTLSCRTWDKVLVPKQAGEWTRIYIPAGDYFYGPDTPHLEEGTWYDEWVPNDHCFVKDDEGYWHIFGITHPLVETDPLSLGIHEGEYASFHAISTVRSFKESLEKGHYMDLPKVLPPSARPGEIPQNHAPSIVKIDSLWHMVYGHSPIRLAVSPNLLQWEPRGELFEDKDGARDPSLLYHEDTWYMVYCSQRGVRLRTSKDLLHWSEPAIIFESEDYDPESPSLIRHNNTFYLFVCSWDGVWDGKEVQGAYQQQTYVLQSDDPGNFGRGEEKQITMLLGHAPEIFQDEEGNWYISGVEWPHRGVSVDKLSWK